MKIVIDIPLGDYEWIKHHVMTVNEQMIANGKLLSEVLDDIKAEIREEKDFAYADFERYKVECLGQDWNDVYDSLPQDDYRYGMERCLEIINKHIGERSE